MSADIVLKVTPDTLDQANEAKENAEKILDACANDGHIVKTNVSRPGCFSYYCVSEYGLRILRRVMRQLLEDFMFLKAKRPDLYDILDDWEF